MELMREGSMMVVMSARLAALAWPALHYAAADFIGSTWTISVDRFAFIS